jgi:SAM-dependent methyltransferase
VRLTAKGDPDAMIDAGQRPATAYDTVAYPTAIFTQTHPDRLGAIAWLHGLRAAEPATARVLEVGCGDGMNLLAMAAAAPAGEFTGFDLASTAIDRGQARAAAAGLRNVRLQVRDLVDAAHELEGSFDYVIAHGLYAWVPDAVRESVFPLLRRVLSPEGIAFVSYNCLPGGYLRMAVRDLMRHFVPSAADAATQLQAAREVLRQFAEPQADDGAALTAYRHEAERTLKEPDALLFHDVLGGDYHPQLHAVVCGEAERYDLIFLADAGRRRVDDGFLPEDVAPEPDLQAQIVRSAQQRDLLELRYFRHSLFVRADAEPRRNFEPAVVAGLWASARYEPQGEGWRGEDGTEFGVTRDAALAAAVERLSEARPARLRVSELGLDELRLRSLLNMYDLRLIQLHTAPAPFATYAPERPQLSALARAMIDEGLERLCSLDHSIIAIEDPEMRRFLAGLDGSRDASAMENLAVECGLGNGRWREAVQLAVRTGLINVAAANWFSG